MEKQSLINLRSLSTTGTELSKSQLKKLAKQKKTKKKIVWNTAKKKNTVLETEVFVNNTPFGEKKDLSAPLAEKYNPDAVESAWDAWWEKSSFYHVSADEVKNLSEDEKFTMVIPPPNVTGSLHIGHALMVTIEDVIARHQRMLGKKVVWVPGTDHAGIGTQAVVEARLYKDRGLRRQDLPRQEFVDLVWKWVDDKGGKILDQIRRMGVSVDHSRSVFTLDETRSKAVAHAFVKMHEMGLIYRKKRLVNWSSALRTAIADIEVEPVEITKPTFLSVKSHGDKKYEFGVIQDFKYPVADEHGNPTDEFITVSTTRLETMLGDTGVAVHPNDPRYTHLHGKFLVHPFFERLIPIVLDGELVNMEFGTGAVKITPAHDPNDYESGQRNNLPMLTMLNDSGGISFAELGTPRTTFYGKEIQNFDGLMRFDARKDIAKQLDVLGLLGDKKPNPMAIPKCSKSGDIIEPLLKSQWWVDTTEMARRSVEAVDNGDLEILPEFHKDTWRRFLTDPHQWCISRQLYWGHQIPAFRVLSDGKEVLEGYNEDQWIIAEDEAEALKEAKAKYGSNVKIEQDPDVLDTWFSSGLFPFSVFGWPDKTDDLEQFFPNSILETGHDIIFFWVARMVMMSLTLMDKLPFKTVYLHAIVRDRFGRKMSKSLGNVIDPLAVVNGATSKELEDTLRSGNLPTKEVEKALKGQQQEFPDGIPKCGADALRFGLLANIGQGRDVNLDIKNIFFQRKFCNKLWQVTRFSLLITDSLTEKNSLDIKFERLLELKLKERDVWILSELLDLLEAVDSSLKNYQFSDLTAQLMQFWLSKFCDVYVESIKPVVKRGDEESEVCKIVTLLILDAGLKLFHPIMPFVTEELWQHLPTTRALKGESNSIMTQEFPTIDLPLYSKLSEKLKQQKNDSTSFTLADKIAHSMRSLKSDFNIPNSKRDVGFSIVVDEARKPNLSTESLITDMQTLGSGQVHVVAESKAKQEKTGIVSSLIDGHLQVQMELKGNVDIGAQIRKLKKEEEKVLKQLDSIVKKLENKKFIENAPEKLLADTKKRKIDLEEQKTKISTQIQQYETV
eukprot:snap_masked-scaffold_72-processed-gene-0.19-mRNA-1 protein AED:0.02 eAED:0.02 QI:0/-1/0/1/-1/1/1/0/1066